MPKLIKIICTVIVLIPMMLSVAAAQIIRDTEIENALRLYSYPLIKQAGLDIRTVRIHIINNDSLNAFIAGGQQIFMHSGTLVEAQTPDEVMGVLAHELGHIAAGHLVSLHEEAEASRRVGLLATLLSVPLAVASGQPGVAVGGAVAGGQLAQGRLLNYTQGMESTADQAALKYLRDENISVQGLVNFLGRLEKLEQIYGQSAPYLRTHPLTEERLVIAKKALAEEQHAVPRPQPTSEIFRVAHSRVRGKIAGHLWDHQRVLREFPLTDTSLAARYARAFSYMLKGFHDEALVEIDGLLAESPNDIFYLEAKGDIYRNAGQMRQARHYYGLALEQAPWASLIHSQWANSLTFAERRDADLVAEALGHAEAALAREPRLYPAWQAKAALEAARGKPRLADVADAEASLLRRDVERALFLAERAVAALPLGSREHSQAEDIIHRAEQIIAQIKDRQKN